jgi:hypothetical protein
MEQRNKDKRRKRKPTTTTFAPLWTPKQLADARKKWKRPEGKTRDILAAVLRRSKEQRR